MIFCNMILKKNSIEEKLLYSSFFTLVFSIVVVTFIMLVYQYIAIKDATLQEIRTQTDIIRDSAAAAVAFADERAASEALYALKSANDIIEAYLILPNKEVLASYHKDKKVEETISERKTEEKITLKHIYISKPIMLRSQEVGYIYVVGSLSSFYVKLSWYIASTLFATSIALFLGRLLAVRISRSITEPLSYLISATKKITTDSDYDTELNVQTSQDEVGDLSMAFKEMMSQIKKRDLSLQQLAYYDRVTNLPNRHYFEEKLSQAVESAQRYGTSFYLMMIDLDDFKIVNDTLGHAMGDLLLYRVGERLMHTLRNSDAIFRIGGDEFAVIIENIPDDKSIQNVAQKVVNAVCAPILLEKDKVVVGASIGISQYPSYAKTKSALVSTADIAMYEAKSKGKNSFQMYKT